MQKIKVVKQSDIKDCGVCSLQSIIAFYGGYVPLEKLRLDTHTDNKGTNALNLIEASKKYGFDSMGVKVDSLFNDAIKLPAIAHTTLKNGLEHFVVIYKIAKDSVYIMDPAKGKITMKIDEFMDIWNKVLLLFYPKEKIVFMPKNNNLFSLFFKILLREKKLFLRIFISSLLLTIFTIISSYYFKVAIEAINKSQDNRLIKIIFLSFFTLLIFKLIFNNYRKRLENHLNKNIDCLLLSGFIEHIFNLPLEVIVSRTSGEIMTRVNELTNIKNLFTEIIISCVLDFFLMLISIPILYSISNNLFFVLLFMVIIYLIIGIFTSRIIYKMAYRNIEYESDFNSTLIEHIKLIKSIKNLNITNSILRKIEKTLSKFLGDSFKLMSFINFQGNMKIWVNEIGLFAINTVGFYLFFKGNIEITELITFNTLVVYFLDPLKYLIDSIPRYSFLKASFNKINDFLSIEQEKYGKKEIITNSEIVFKDLSYSYNNYNKVLNKISFKLKKGEMALLKGVSGSGKSTICKILEKYITDFDGTVLIGGINIKDMSISTIRSNIVYISQNESLVTGTIRENILLDRNITEDRFQEICKLCFVDEIVDKKPMRYETIINDETHYLSGGERQRIILARALMQDSPIYLIDEALSEVDYKLERAIINNLQEHFKDKTIICITHKNQDDLFKKIISVGDSHGL